MSMKICVRTTFVGTHCWKSCPIEEVSFLQYPHRHTFYVEIKTKVDEDDRELEFFMVKKELDFIIEILYGVDSIRNLGGRSCETICREILNQLKLVYPLYSWEVSVFEDNEVGAIYTPE